MSHEFFALTQWFCVLFFLLKYNQILLVGVAQGWNVCVCVWVCLVDGKRKYSIGRFMDDRCTGRLCRKGEIERERMSERESWVLFTLFCDREKIILELAIIYILLLLCINSCERNACGLCWLLIWFLFRFIVEMQLINFMNSIKKSISIWLFFC